jgi:type II secretion system protein H
MALTSRPSDRRGFSLVEIMVALVIIGIAAAIVAPNFRRSLDRARFDRAAGELQSDLRLAMSTARATGRTVRVDFTADGYLIVDAADSTRVVRSRDFGGSIGLAASDDPLVFPWGLVQPTEVQISSPHRYSEFRILPTGRVEDARRGGR